MTLGQMMFVEFSLEISVSWKYCLHGSLVTGQSEHRVCEMPLVSVCSVRVNKKKGVSFMLETIER